MNILSLGLDNSILDKTSKLADRASEYGRLADKYYVLVPSQKKEFVRLSEKVIAYGSGGGNKIIQLFRLYQSAKKLLSEEKYQIITVQDQYYLAFVGLKLAGMFGIGLEIQIHGFEKYQGLRKAIADYVLPKADSIRCVSQRLKRELIDKFGVAEEKITVVPIYSASKLSISDSRFKRDYEKFIFLTVGRLVPVKNIGLQVDAMKEMTEKYPYIELWIIGDGSEKEALKSKIGNQNSKIKMLGRQNDLAKYYEQADAFLLTSNSEGWGLAVIEAASRGLPIIMTDVGCAGEVIKNGESGLIIPIGDKDALIKAMSGLITDVGLRRRLGHGAHEAALCLPDKNKIAALYLESWRKAESNL